jgi:predicted MFS family arabinose efflux permease
MSDTVTSLHNSFFGWSLLAVAFAPLGRWSRSTIMRVGTLLIAAGATLFGSATSVMMSLSGALLFGSGAALMVQVIPAIVADRFPEQRTAVFAKLNTMPVAVGVTMPLLVTAAAAADVSWRIPVLFLGPGFGLLCFALLLGNSASLNPSQPVPQRSPASVFHLLRHQPVRTRFFLQTANIAIEFSIGSWVVVYLRDIGGASTGTAPLGALGFGLGMMTGRLLTHRLRSLLGRHLEVSIFLGVAVVTALLTRTANPLLIVACTTLIAFLVGPAYALGVDRLFATSHAVGVLDDDSIGAVGALASGAGVVIAPTLVGAISDAAGLRTALLIPALGAGVLAALALLQWRGEAGQLGT